METVRFNSGEVRQVTSRHAEKLVAAKEAEIVNKDAQPEQVKEVKDAIQTRKKRRHRLLKRKSKCRSGKKRGKI